MNDDTQECIDDAREIVREIDRWADAKIDSGKPATPAEVEVIQQMKLTLRKLQQRLREIRSENNFPTT